MKIGRINHRHFVAVGIILLSAGLIPLCFRYAHLRIAESGISLAGSFMFYISQLFDLNLTGKLTVNDLTAQPFPVPFNLPLSWDEFAANMKNYWGVFFSKDNFVSYISGVGDFLSVFIKVLMVLIPVVFVFFAVRLIRGDKTTTEIRTSRSLKRFKWIELHIILPVAAWIYSFIEFIRDHKYYLHVFALVWLYSFNGIAIILSVLSYYFYFLASFKTATIYIQLVKLLMDLSVIPAFLWVIFALWAINKFRRHLGYNRLNSLENCNSGFIEDRAIVFMLCGSMGKKKTTLLTDMTLSQEQMFRDKAFEKLRDADMKFPHFPWLQLERTLRKALHNHSVYNLATCVRFVKSKYCKFRRHPYRRNIFGYDYERYGTDYNNGLYVEDIWNVIGTYVLLYFIYSLNTSLILSNYSIRSDAGMDDGNFPMWDCDPFRRDPRLISEQSKYSHILDFDSVRLGKKIDSKSKTVDSFEFGCVSITEMGKERGNQKTNGVRNKKTYNKAPELANQDNDLFDIWLKMIRHSGTVDFYPFVRVICDEQRPESLGADARELAEIVHIQDCSEFKLAMPLFFFEDFFINIFLAGHSKRYYKYRHDRADHTLPMYLYHKIMSWLWKYQQRVYNTFGYYDCKLGVEAGTQDGEIKTDHYYLMNKKIYARRFATDAFSDYFNNKALRSSVGLQDLPTYGNVKATLSELESQNSYFIRDITKYMSEDDP